jgi:hypothetical protein
MAQRIRKTIGKLRLPLPPGRLHEAGVQSL